LNWSNVIPDFLRFGSKDKTFFFRGYNFLSVTPAFNSYGKDLDKLKKVFSSPALCKVITLNCDLFSLGKIYVYKDGKDVENDAFLSMINTPNPFQSTQQFLWDYMFWNMVGNAYLYIDSDVVSNSNKLYWLTPSQMEFDSNFEEYKDKLILSSISQNSVGKLKVTYRYSNGGSMVIDWSRIQHYADMTNGTGNWFKGNSRIDSLGKIIDNAELSIKSKNINLDFSGKFLIGGVNDAKDPSKRPLTAIEKEDIEEKALGYKSVSAVKSMFDLKRFVTDMGALKLDEAYFADAFIIGNAFNIPKDVIESYLSASTYENQEKARGAHVSYCLEPKGEAFFSPLNKRFKYLEQGKKICMSWDHLPFMQFAEKERLEVKLKTTQAILNLQKAGATESDINEFLDTKFTNLNPVQNVAEPKQQEPTAGATNASE
jgi:hypothetical protein